MIDPKLYTMLYSTYVSYSVECGIHCSYHPRSPSTFFCSMESDSGQLPWIHMVLLARGSGFLPSRFHLCLLHDIVNLRGQTYISYIYIDRMIDYIHI